MEYLTIRQVSRNFGVSTRTLRYYEELGLLQSTRQEAYAYRVYTEESIQRLRQILILRNLHIPLRQIAAILANPSSKEALDLLQSNLSHIHDEINALQIVKRALAALIAHLQRGTTAPLSLDSLTAQELSDIAGLCSLPKHHFREEPDMNEFIHANERLNQFENTRILFIPPATVASFQSSDPEPEHTAEKAIAHFIVTTHLFDRKPDYRQFGFNNPNCTAESDFHGYEFWVTIPDDMEVPVPYIKKHMPGGLYAAHCIRMGNFEEWQPFWQWVQQHEDYVYEKREPFAMDGCLEEHLNPQSQYANLVPEHCEDILFSQVDLLIPIKRKDERA